MSCEPILNLPIRLFATSVEASALSRDAAASWSSCFSSASASSELHAHLISWPPGSMPAGTEFRPISRSCTIVSSTSVTTTGLPCSLSICVSACSTGSSGWNIAGGTSLCSHVITACCRRASRRLSSTTCWTRSRLCVAMSRMRRTAFAASGGRSRQARLRSTWIGMPQLCAKASTVSSLPLAFSSSFGGGGASATFLPFLPLTFPLAFAFPLALALAFSLALAFPLAFAFPFATGPLITGRPHASSSS
mmetsp:Transcript_57983/g.170195  ORF Transcript_57983/g.170195 Transcript_57983/m.170195 type:complete len:249 (+) Transcript_57983:989-1735(+)